MWEDSVCCALVLTDDFIDKHADTAKAFVEGYKTAGNNLNSETAQTVAEKYLKQKKDVLETSLKWISYDDLEITEEQYNKLTEKVKEYGLSDNPPAYSEFVKNDF